MLSNRLKFLIFNLVGLEITWGACAYGAINDLPLLGVYVAIAYIVLHFIYVDERLRDFCVIISVGLLGIIMDVVNTKLNVLSFSIDSQYELVIPYWLIALWAVFSLMIPHSLYWLRKNLIFASFIGALVGSLTYLLGHKLGALSMSEPLTISYVVILIEWAIFFPLSLIIVKYITSSLGSDKNSSQISAR